MRSKGINKICLAAISTILILNFLIPTLTGDNELHFPGIEKNCSTDLSTRTTGERIEGTRGERILVFDDVEGQQSFSGDFQPCDEDSNSPTHSYHESPGGDYDPNSQYMLALGVDLNLEDALDPAMEFWYTIQAQEDDMWGKYVDGGVVSCSTDGGQNWAAMTPSNAASDPNYQQLSGSSALTQATGVTQAYTGYSGVWRKATFDLSPYVGSTSFRIMFGFVPTPVVSSGDDGWYIDDIKITATNRIPETPILLQQGNHTEQSATGVVEDPVTLSWRCDDPDQDIITNYTINVATQSGVNSDSPSVPQNAWVLRTTLNSSQPFSDAPNSIALDVEDGVQYYWAVKASDGFDWSPWSPEFTFITNNPPEATILSISPTSPKEQEPVTFEGEGSDPDGDAISRYKWVSNKDGVLGTDATIQVGLSEGGHQISFMVRDQNWEWSEAVDTGITVGKNNAPSIVTTSPSSDSIIITQGETQTFEVDVEDPETPKSNLAITWYLDDEKVDEGFTYKLKTTLGSDLKDDHAIKVEVSDGVLSAAYNWSVYINVLPEILTKSPTSSSLSIQETESIDFSVEAKDDNSDDHVSYKWYLDGKELVGENSNSYTLTTDYSTSRQRPYKIEVRVSDSYGQYIKTSWDITVENVIQDIYLVHWEPYEREIYVEEGKTQVFLIDAVSNDTTLAYHWFLEDHEIGSGPVLSYTPDYDSEGNYTLEVIVTDEIEDTADLSHSWKVNVINVNRKPVAIISLPDLSYYEAGAGAIPFDGSQSYDPDGDELTFKWFNEAGKEINTKSSFETELSPGVRTITLKVIDEEGAFSQDRTMFTVAAPDVVLLDVQLNKDKYYLEEGGTITLKLKNRGLIAARDVDIIFKANDMPIAQFTVFISAGETETVVVPWTASETDMVISVDISSKHEGVIPGGHIYRYLTPNVVDREEEREIKGDGDEIDWVLVPIAAAIIAFAVIDSIFLLTYKDVFKKKR